jgi:hypothetical protein
LSWLAAATFVFFGLTELFSLAANTRSRNPESEIATGLHPPGSTAKKPAAFLAHDPEKWTPLFEPDRA